MVGKTSDANRIHVTLLTPGKRLFDDAAAAVSIPAEMGIMEVRPGHAPLVAQLGSGILRVGDKSFAVLGGLVEIRDNQVVLLADAAETVDGIDEDRARSSLSRAHARLTSSQEASIDYERALRAEQRATVRLKLALLRRGSGKGEP